MKTLSITLPCIIPLFYCFLTGMSAASVSLVQLNSGQPKFYPTDTYDTYATSALLTAVEGSTTYAFGVWFKPIAYPPTGATALIFTMTMLNNYYPDKTSSVPTSQQHLSRMLCFSLDSSGTLTHYAPTFALPTQSFTFSSGPQLLQWTYGYASFNTAGGETYAAIFNYYNSLAAVIDQTPSPAQSPANEYLDSRLQIYVGGGKNRISTNSATWATLSGYSYNPTFFVNFFSNTAANIRVIMNGDYNSLFIFPFDETSSQVFTDRTQGINTAVLGSSPSVDSADPTQSGVNGLVFNGNNDYLTITLSSPAGQFFWVSMWVLVNSNSPSTTFQSILTFVTPSGKELVALGMQKSTYDIFFRVNENCLSSQSYSLTGFNTGNWYNYFLTVSAVVFNGQVVANLAVGDPSSGVILAIDSNSIGCTPPSDSESPITTIILGQAVSSAKSFDGSIKSLKAGNGAYFSIDSTTTDPCLLKIGLTSPYCLAGGLLYRQEPDGTTSNVNCESGTYFDQGTNMYQCQICHPNCADCIGPGSDNCIACGSVLPYLFGVSCFASCPPGSFLSNLTIYYPSNLTCTCDPSCSTCSYSSSTGQVSCSACVSSSQYLAGDGTCVNPSGCPPGTFADPSTQSCASSCSSGVWDTVNKMCSTACPTGTMQYVSGNTYCYLTCPSQTYQSAITTPPAGTALYQCLSCSSPCYECSSATTCTSCQPGYFFHTGANICSTSCHTGYVLDPISGFTCTPCRTSCTVCASGTYLISSLKTCVNSCPIGYLQNPTASTCNLQTGVFVAIVNYTASPPLIINTNTDLVILAQYYSSNPVSSMIWTLSGSSYGYSDEFFNLVNKSSPMLIVRQRNLRWNTQYTVNFTVTDTSGNQASALFSMQTVPLEVTPGLYSITPSIGYGGLTTFQINVTGWTLTPSTKTYNFDVTAFYERVQNVSNNIYFEQMDHQRIVIASSTQGNFSFIFPPSVFNKTYVVELRFYTADQVVTRRESVTVLIPNSTAESTFQVLLWKGDLTVTLTLDTILELAQYLNFLYARNETEFYTRVSNSGVNLINTTIENGTFSDICDPGYHCNGNGICQVLSANIFQCVCNSEYSGRECQYNVRDYEVIGSQAMLLLSQAFVQNLSDPIQREQVLQVLYMVRTNLDLLTTNGILAVRDLINIMVTSTPTLDQYQIRAAIDVCGELIYYFARPVGLAILTGFDQRDFLRNVTEIIFQAIELIPPVINEGDYYVFETAILKVFINNTVPLDGFRDANGNYTNNYTLFRWESIGYEIPQEMVAYQPRVSLRFISMNQNPYINASTVDSISTMTALRAYSPSGRMPVRYLVNRVNVWVPKVAATPLWDYVGPANNTYGCAYYDDYSAVVRANGVSNYNETEEHIICSSDHLTGFVAYMNQGNLRVGSLPDGGTIRDTNNEYIATNLSANYYKFHYLPYSYYVPPPATIPPLPYQWLNPGLICTIAFVVLAVIGMRWNFIVSRKKNSLVLTLKEIKPFLIMTYHPFFSIWLRVHTQTSNTQTMRVSKFVFLLSVLMGMSAVFLSSVVSNAHMSISDKAMFSGFFGMVFTPIFTYFTEWFYLRMIRKYKQSKRTPEIYHAIHWTLTAGFLIMICAILGYDSTWGVQWMGAFLFAFALDFLVFDMVAILWVLYQNNMPGKTINLLRMRGFYVDIGYEAVIKDDTDIKEVKRRLEKNHEEEADEENQEDD